MKKDEMCSSPRRVDCRSAGPVFRHILTRMTDEILWKCGNGGSHGLSHGLRNNDNHTNWNGNSCGILISVSGSCFGLLIGIDRWLLGVERVEIEWGEVGVNLDHYLAVGADPKQKKSHAVNALLCSRRTSLATFGHGSVSLISRTLRRVKEK